MAFDIEGFQHLLAEGKRPLRITTHAQVEAFKEGLLLADLRHVLETGKVIEEHGEGRVLLFGWAVTIDLPIHLVVEMGDDEIVLITAYVPAPSDWIGYTRRRRRRRR